MAREMAEEVATHVAGHGHESRVANPARQPPQQVVGGNQGDEDAKPATPRPLRARAQVRQRVDEQLDAVLGDDRAQDGERDRRQDDGVGQCVRLT